jgi:hypothetical protein
MACRGWYIALLPQEASSLLALTDVDQRVEFLNSLYTAAAADGRQQSVDKSWDAMHRCLCDGWLDDEHGEEANRACVVGGRQLSDRRDYIISYVEPTLVRRVAVALEGISREWFLSQYFSLEENPPGEGVHRYEMYLVEPDVDSTYTWGYFVQVRDFYQAAAERGLATAFIVDQ